MTTYRSWPYLWGVDVYFTGLQKNCRRSSQDTKLCPNRVFRRNNKTATYNWEINCEFLNDFPDIAIVQYVHAICTPPSIQAEKTDPDLLYNLLCVLKPLVDYGFYTPWNEVGNPDYRKKREENNNRMTKHFVKLCSFEGNLFMIFNITMSQWN